MLPPPCSSTAKPGEHGVGIPRGKHPSPCCGRRQPTAQGTGRGDGSDGQHCNGRRPSQSTEDHHTHYRSLRCRGVAVSMLLMQNTYNYMPKCSKLFKLICIIIVVQVSALLSARNATAKLCSRATMSQKKPMNFCTFSDCDAYLAAQNTELHISFLHISFLGSTTECVFGKTSLVQNCEYNIIL